MASQRRSTTMLLASLILLLFWTNSPVRSHDASALSAAYRVKRDLSPGDRDKADKVLNGVKDSLNIFKDVMETIDTNQMTDVIKGLASIANLAPGIGSLAASVINMILIFIPQEDAVLEEVKKGFADVNRRLDSFSNQISNLKTHVEWVGYASVYSQDENTILNSWLKFSNLQTSSVTAGTEEEKQQEVRIFTDFFENAGTESSVLNLYRYLTVSSTSLGKNLNELLKEKFKCNINDIGRFNIYLSSLLTKGLMLNQVYWKLKGYNLSGKEAEQAQMLKAVYDTQKSTIDHCLTNYEQYLKQDVVEIAKTISPDDKTAIATQVKAELDTKYNWYSWVVLVYETKHEDSSILVSRVTKIPVDDLTVAVAFTRKAFINRHVKQLIPDAADRCLRESNRDCKTLENLDNCVQNYQVDFEAGELTDVRIDFKDYGITPLIIYRDYYVEVPAPEGRVHCLWDGYDSNFSIHVSKNENVCSGQTCNYRGTCKRILESNDWLCECNGNYYGNRCEKYLGRSK